MKKILFVITFIIIIFYLLHINNIYADPCQTVDYTGRTAGTCTSGPGYDYKTSAGGTCSYGTCNYAGTCGGMSGCPCCEGWFSVTCASSTTYYCPGTGCGTPCSPNSAAGCASSCVPPYIDIGLKIYDGTQIVTIAIEPTGTVTSPLRIAKNGTIYGVVLVATTDSMASKMRINTSAGIKALRKM